MLAAAQFVQSRSNPDIIVLAVGIVIIILILVAKHRSHLKAVKELNNLTTKIEDLKKHNLELIQNNTKLKNQLTEAIKLNDLTIGRELKMLELKREIEKIKKGES